ncbi:hypothetical protein K150096H7_24140 [[Clostridium] symbiosum]
MDLGGILRLYLPLRLKGVQTVPEAIHSGRIPPSTTNLPRGRKSQAVPSRHTGHGPFRTRSPGLS